MDDLAHPGMDAFALLFIEGKFEDASSLDKKVDVFDLFPFIPDKFSLGFGCNC